MSVTRTAFLSIALPVLLAIGNAGAALAAADTVTAVTGLALSRPAGITVTPSDVFIADTGHNQVTNKDASIVIGDGVAGFLDGLKSSAQLNAPTGVATFLDATDGKMYVYIADTGNNRIRRYSFSDDTVTTVAGNGIAGFSGDTGDAKAASLKAPTAVAVDPAGVIYIADNGNYRIRRVASGKIDTIAGDGNAATLTAYGLALASPPAGDLYIADSGNSRILKIAAAKLSALSTPAVFAGTGVAGHSGDGGLATLARLNQPSGIATNGIDLYITDTMNNCVRKVSLATNVISTRAGSVAQAAAIAAPFLSPDGIAIDSTGNLYVADSGNNLAKQISASTSAVTTITPVGGIYTQDQTISLTSNKPALIYYTTDGSAPLTSPTKITYSGSFLTSGNTSIKYASTDSAGGNPEVTSTVNYVINTTAPVTTPSLAAGVYYSAQSALSITLTAADPTDPAPTIYYTKDGTVPSLASPKYTAPISIAVTGTSTTTNLQFFAVNKFGNKETVKSRKYTVAALTTTASPSGGLYASAKDVALTANDTSAVIHYTTDGTAPTTASATYAAPVHLSATGSLQFFAVDSSGVSESVKSEVYRFDYIVPVTTASIPGGFYTSAQTVTLTADDPTASIYFSTSGTAPTISPSTKYAAPVPISATSTLLYFAVDPAGNKESLKSQSYTIDSTAPATTASIKTGTYASIQTVTLSANDPTAIIYYSLDGSIPNLLSPRYTIPLAISKSTTFKYYAVDSVGNAEAVKTQVYTIIALTTTASPAGGTFASTQTVTLASNEAGATIYYTTDGTTPTKSSSKYTKPILISETTTSGSTTTVLQFFSADTAGVSESPKSEIYAVDSITPATTVKCLVNTAAPLNTVKLTATDPADVNPAIRYRLYGGALTEYTKPFAISSDSIITFFAVDAAGNTEQVSSGYCPIDPLNPKPALYLETLAGGATTSNGTLHLRGYVAPFKTTTLTIQQNGGAPVTITPSATDGSFTHSLPLAAGANTIVAVATDSATSLSTAPDSRTVVYATPGPTPTHITIGTSSGVKGNAVKLPITLAGGYQAAAVGIDIAYDTTKLSIPSAVIAPAAAAADKSISTGTPSAGVFRVLIIENAPAPGKTVSPVPDGEIAYLTFGIDSAGSGSSTLTITPSSADVGETALATTGTNGNVNIRVYPGDADGDGTVTIAEVLSALYMLLDPVLHPVDGAMDLNADGLVSISELQQIINTFLEL